MDWTSVITKHHVLHSSGAAARSRQEEIADCVTSLGCDVQAHSPTASFGLDGVSRPT